jgi:hypothetical protein
MKKPEGRGLRLSGKSRSQTLTMMKVIAELALPQANSTLYECGLPPTIALVFYLSL